MTTSGNTTTRNRIEALSRVIEPYAAAKEDYLKGMGVRAVMRKYHLNRGEMRDIAPQEFEDDDHATPEGNGGY